MENSLTCAQSIACTYMNRDSVEVSRLCGCYSCLRSFSPVMITLWADSTDPKDDDPGALRSDEDAFRGFTAVCPFCENTSVIGDASVEEISEAFLRKIHDYCSKGR
jgi:hypothetical protein